jgi:hypothetical protein
MEAFGQKVILKLGNKTKESLFTNPDQKKYKTFTIPDGIKEVAHKNILIRAVKDNLNRPESFSEYLRNLVMEDHERNLNNTL